MSGKRTSSSKINHDRGSTASSSPRTRSRGPVGSPSGRRCRVGRGLSPGRARGRPCPNATLRWRLRAEGRSSSTGSHEHESSRVSSFLLRSPSGPTVTSSLGARLLVEASRRRKRMAGYFANERIHTPKCKNASPARSNRRSSGGTLRVAS